MATCKDCLHYELCEYVGTNKLYPGKSDGCRFMTDRTKWMQKKLESCDVCNGRSIITQDCDNGYSLEVDSEQQEIAVWCGDECVAIFSVDYCPHCGSKMGL